MSYDIRYSLKYKSSFAAASNGRLVLSRSTTYLRSLGFIIFLVTSLPDSRTPPVWTPESTALLSEESDVSKEASRASASNMILSSFSSTNSAKSSFLASGRFSSCLAKKSTTSKLGPASCYTPATRHWRSSVKCSAALVPLRFFQGIESRLSSTPSSICLQQ